MTVEWLGGNRVIGLSSERTSTSFIPISYDNSTAVFGMTATGGTISGASVSGSWQSYIRSTQFISPSTGGGEVRLTGYAYTTNNKNLAFGLEKAPHKEFPNDIYKCANYGWHFTSSAAGNDIYEKANNFDIAPVSNSTSQVWKITMDSAGLVKYFVDDVLVRTSTVTASGNYYVIAGFAGNSPADTAVTTISSVTTLTNIQTGCEFHETDTNKDYVYNGSSWVYITP